MLTKTFTARVRGGRIEHGEPLNAFEGQEVRVTLAIAESCEAPGANGMPAGPEPPEWLEVERDEYFPMPRKTEPLPGMTIIDRGRMPPCRIVPEVLPDE